MLRVQYVIGRDLKVREQLNFAEIPRGKPEILIFLVIDQQYFPIEAQLRQCLCKRLRLVILETERLDDIQLVLFELESES